MEGGQRLLEDVRLHLETGMTSKAEEALDAAEREIGEDPDLRLQLARWRALVDAAVRAREEGNASDFRDAASLLIEAVETLQADEWSSAERLLASAMEKLPDGATKARVEDLQREVDLRGSLIRAVELREGRQWAEATEAYEAAERSLAAIRYRDSLAPLIVDLARERAACEEMRQAVRRLKEIDGRILDRVKSSDYAGIQSLCEEAVRLTRGKGEIRRGVTDARALARELEGLRHARQRAGAPAGSLTAQALDLMARYPDQPAVRRAVEETVIQLLPALERRAEMAKAIDEIENTLSLGRNLEKLGQSVGAPQENLERINQALGQLDEKVTAYRDAQRQILEPGEEQTKSRAQVLAEAERAGVQVIEDRQLSDRIREAALLEGLVREYSRRRDEWEGLSRQLQRLRDEFREARADMGFLKDEISEETLLDVEEKIAMLESAAQGASHYKEMLSTLPRPTTLKEEAADRAEALRESLVQQQLNAAISALRWFQPDRAVELLQRAQVLLSGYPKLAEAYDEAISLVASESEMQSRWEGDRRRELSDWRETIEDGGSLSKGAIGRLNSLAREINSVSLRELFELAHARSERVEAETAATGQPQGTEASKQESRDALGWKTLGSPAGLLLLGVLVVSLAGYAILLSNSRAQTRTEATVAQTAHAAQLTAVVATMAADAARQEAAQATSGEVDVLTRVAVGQQTREAAVKATATAAPMSTSTRAAEATATTVAKLTATAAEATAEADRQARATAAAQAARVTATWAAGPGGALAIDGGGSQEGQISPPGDEDWFTFTISDTSAISLETSGDSGDTLLTLYASTLEQIARDDDGGEERFSRIDRDCAGNPLRAGTYYVKVNEYQDEYEIPSYAIALDVSTCR